MGVGLEVGFEGVFEIFLNSLYFRTARGRFHLFANGALAIDCCLRDRRLAVAFGSSVYALDFGGGEEKEISTVSTTRLTTAPKAWKFYQVSWNNVSDSERLGSLALGNSGGEVLHYDLNERVFVGKGGGGGGFSTKNLSGFAKGVGDASKIYKFVWPVKVAAGSGGKFTSKNFKFCSNFSLLFRAPTNCRPQPARLWRDPHQLRALATPSQSAGGELYDGEVRRRAADDRKWKFWKFFSSWQPPAAAEALGPGRPPPRKGPGGWQR